jgi:glutathione S-transferase
MSLTIHHLQISQSERLPWLCEELNIPYTLVLHQRTPIFSPQSIKDLNPLGQAPVLQDGSLTLAESAACADYIAHKYGDDELTLPSSHKNYADDLYWFHSANGNLQPHVQIIMQLFRIDPTGTSVSRATERLGKLLALMDTRLAGNAWLAGDDFTLADIMTVFSLTTMRTFCPFDLTEYRGILAYLERVAQREGYKKSRAKADPELELMIDGKPPQAYAERLKK